jgi:hypothetical protein
MFIFRSAAEAANHVDDDRILGHALTKGVKVLLAEHGGWHKDRDLFTCEYRLECRADGDLGLAEADVATD